MFASPLAPPRRGPLTSPPVSAITRRGSVPHRATGRSPKRSQPAGRQPVVHRRGLRACSKFSPKTLAFPCSASSPAVGCEVSANAVAPTDIVALPMGPIWFTQSAGGNPRDGEVLLPGQHRADHDFGGLQLLPGACLGPFGPGAGRDHGRPQRQLVVHRDGDETA